MASWNAVPGGRPTVAGSGVSAAANVIAAGRISGAALAQLGGTDIPPIGVARPRPAPTAGVVADDSTPRGPSPSNVSAPSTPPRTNSSRPQPAPLVVTVYMLESKLIPLDRKSTRLNSSHV